VHIRREIWGLESNEPFDPITLAYAQAVVVMQARDPSDPTSWRFQAALHGSVRQPPPGVAGWADCQHGSWFFLPWHRIYLYYFERIVRAAALEAGGPQDWALPYWNYDRPFPANTMPPAFRAPKLPDGAANPLFLGPPQRAAGVMNGAQIPPQVTSPAAALALTSDSSPPTPSFGGQRIGPVHFDGGFGAIESTPHNVMHPTIGGQNFGSGVCGGALMTDPDCAALDPVFWLHHANIDRLWNVWISQPRRANPTDAGWLRQQFDFYDEHGAQVRMSPGEVLDSATQLQYVYDDMPSFRLADVTDEQPAERDAGRPPELAAATEQPFELAGGAHSVTLTVPSSARSLVAGPAEGHDARMLVRVEDIEAERDPAIVYGVYLNLPEDDDDADRLAHHVGNISFFGIEQAQDPDLPPGGGVGWRHTFDATNVVNALKLEDRWDPDDLRVTFEPIALLAPPGEELPPGDRGDSVPVAPVKIGRVSVFAA